MNLLIKETKFFRVVFIDWTPNWELFIKSNFLSSILQPLFFFFFSEQETTYNYPDNVHQIKDLRIDLYTQIASLKFAVYV